MLGTQPKIPVPGLAGCCTGRKEKVNIFWNEWNSESEFEDAALALFYLHTAWQDYTIHSLSSFLSDPTANHLS